jgi:hypothetical protein
MDYLNYQLYDGDNVAIYVFDTTADEEAQIKYNIEKNKR